MSLVSTILTGAADRIFSDGKAISTTTEPTEPECIQWLNETSSWILAICAERKSELGRTTGTITTIAATITAATKANPCSITSTAHGLVTGDEVLIKDVLGMTELNDTWYTITRTSANAYTLDSTDSSSYTTYTSAGTASQEKYDDFSSDLYAPYEFGWIEKTSSRAKIYLTIEEARLNYSPSGRSQPDKFYVDGSNNVIFLSTPDDAYTVKIPYWQIPTTLTLTTETVPFYGIFDNLYIEAIALRGQNRDEYDLAFELKWQTFLITRAERVIEMRKGMNVRVGV